MMTKNMENNLWTALVTPMQKDGAIDYESLGSLLKEQKKAGVAVLILGSTGEALNIGAEQKKEIIRFACQQNLNLPLMVGVGGSQLEETLEWIDFLNTHELHSYLLVTPHYAKPGARGQENWFRSLLDRSQRPCVLYNVPGRAACSLSIEALIKLNNHPNFVGIKEASGSVADFKKYRDNCTGKILYCGDDALMWDFAREGAQGLISVASNPWPAQTKLYVESSLNGTLNDAEIQLWKEASLSLFEASNPVPAKVLLHELGRIQNSTLLAPLSHEDLPGAKNQLLAHSKIGEWYFSKTTEGNNHVGN